MENNWINEINELLKDDPVHAELLARVEKLEPEYLRICRMLSEEDREVLSDYIAACEELDYHRIFPAYRLGRTHGRWGK